MVRGHAAWALGQVGSSEAVSALALRSEIEPDAFAREEVDGELSSWRDGSPGS